MDAGRAVSASRRVALEKVTRALNPTEVLTENDIADRVSQVVAQRDELAALLWLVLHELHPTHGNTAHHSGGLGGQMMTPCCHVIGEHERWEALVVERADAALYDVFDSTVEGLIALRIDRIREHLRRTAEQETGGG